MTAVKSQSSLVGASGEHFVLYRLLRMGYLAALAPQGAPNADIIATNVSGEKTAVIQVKTRASSKKGWHMKSKHEAMVSDKMFYCFVDLHEDETRLPTVFIIPSKIVAKALQETHSVWLNTLGRGGKAHQATEMRWLQPDYSRTLKLSGDLLVRYGQKWIEPYKENWKVLGLD